jgi:hypothetical protein
MFSLETKPSSNKPREEAKPMPRFRETATEAYEVLRPPTTLDSPKTHSAFLIGTRHSP